MVAGQGCVLALDLVTHRLAQGIEIVHAQTLGELVVNGGRHRDTDFLHCDVELRLLAAKGACP